MRNEKRQPAPASADPLTPGLRSYLYFTAAMTGAAIMIVEILGAKMLAPYFGTSHFVWTAQIAVTLVALATGYYAGGRIVDRSPRLGRLYWAVLSAAIYLGLTTLVVEQLAYWCLDFKLALGSLLASAILFFLPLALLAMVGPFFVRVLTLTIAVVGTNAGRLTAISTLGSFAGTVLIGYVLIPLLPNSAIMYVTSLALMAASAGYFFGWGRGHSSLAQVSIVVVLGAALGGIGMATDRPVKGRNWREVYRANSNFGRLQVISARNDTLRYYLNDFLEQNSYDTRLKDSDASFTYMLHGLARGYGGAISNVLCIGLGTGIVPMKFARDGATVDVVEINPAVVPLAEKFFDLDTRRLALTLDDGRHFLNRCNKRYDAIILDAFLGDSSPSHLMSREAFSAMRRVLKPDGVLVMNCFGSLETEMDFLTASLDKTLQAVFRTVRLHTAGGNFYFVASDQANLEIHSRLDLAAVHENCRQAVATAYVTVVKPDPRHGLVLTDDYNPVEYYDAANREIIRRALAKTLKID